MAEAIKAYISTLDKKMKIFHQILSIFFGVNEKVIINGKLQQQTHATKATATPTTAPRVQNSPNRTKF